MMTTTFYLEREEDGRHGGECKKEIILGTAPVDVGRGDLEVNDRKCSRRQVTVAPGAGSAFTVTAHGVNPSLVSRSDGTRVILRAGESAEVSVGDRVSLLCDGTHTFVLKERKEAQELPPPPPKWSWLDDDGWVEYSEALERKLEAAYKAKEKECLVDAERFVDLASMEQKRRDNPTKRRKVKREERAQNAAANAASAVIHFAKWSDVPFFLGTQLEARKDVQLARDMTPAVTHVVAPKAPEDQKRAAALLAGAESHGAAVVTYKWVEEYARAWRLPDPKKYAFSVQVGAKAPLGAQSPQKRKEMKVSAPQSTQAVMMRPGEYAVWMWRKDDGTFEEYRKEVSDKIERAYQITGPDAPRTVGIGGKRYVDLMECMQRIHGIDDIERQVIRETRKK